MGSTLSLGINAYEANVENRVGSNLYAYQLLRSLELHTRGMEPTANAPVVEITVYLPSTPLADMPKERPGFQYRVIGPPKLWTQWRLPLELFLHPHRHTVFLSLGHYAPRFCPYPSVICILDLAFLLYPQFFLPKDLYQLTTWTRYSVKNASRIITISEASKNDIIRLYSYNEASIDIVYPGVEEKSPSQDQATLQATIQHYGLRPRDYIISVGTIQPRKNLLALIKAFEIFNAAHDHRYKLVFAGKKGWLTEDFTLCVDQSPERERIVLTGFIEEQAKTDLVSQALCSASVGFYEGFGIPAAESLLLGVRPIVANTASLPEVVGDYGILVDPFDTASIAAGMEAAALHQPEGNDRSRMRGWILEQFSWDRSALRLLESLQRFVTNDGALHPLS